MSSGRIVQIIGAVIDVEFPRENVPKVYDALTVDGTETTLEVQQQLGDGVVVFWHQLLDADRWIGQLNAVCRSQMSGGVIPLGRVQQCFTGNAAYIQAGSPQNIIFFNDCGFHSQLCATDCCHIATGTRTNYCYIISAHKVFLLN